MIRSKPSPTTEFRTDLVRSTLPILSHEKNKVKRFHPRFSIVFIQTLSLPRKPSTTWTIAAYAILRRFLRASTPLSAPSVTLPRSVLPTKLHRLSIILPVCGVLLLPAFPPLTLPRYNPKEKEHCPPQNTPSKSPKHHNILCFFFPQISLAVSHFSDLTAKYSQSEKSARF